jgi:hypothetical protein
MNDEERNSKNQTKIGVTMQDSNYRDSAFSTTLGPPKFSISPCTGGYRIRPYNTGQNILTGADSELACDENARWQFNGGPAAAPAGGWYGYGASPSSNARWIAAQCDGNAEATGTTNLFTTGVGIPEGTKLTTTACQADGAPTTGLIR